MKALLITNKYMQSEKFLLLKERFIENAKILNIELDYKNNFEAYELIGERICYDFILFYDKDIKLAKLLEDKGFNVFNKSSAISICDDKFLTYMKLENIVHQPKTIPAPFLYYDDLSNDGLFIKKCEDNFSYPMILKECSGSFGLQVYKVDSRDELINCIRDIKTKPFIIQEFIKTSYGRDVRLQVVGDRVVAAMKRVNENGDFRANVTNGATAYEYEPTDEEIKLAVTATKTIGVDFAGVDLLFGENDKPLLCEVNSNAHLEIIGKVSNRNIYIEVLKYIIEKVK